MPNANPTARDLALAEMTPEQRAEKVTPGAPSGQCCDACDAPAEVTVHWHGGEQFYCAPCQAEHSTLPRPGYPAIFHGDAFNTFVEKYGPLAERDTFEREAAAEAAAEIDDWREIVRIAALETEVVTLRAENARLTKCLAMTTLGAALYGAQVASEMGGAR